MNRYEITPDMSDGKKKKLLELIEAREELKDKISNIENKIFERCLLVTGVALSCISVINPIRNSLISFFKGSILLSGGLLVISWFVIMFGSTLILWEICPSIRGYKKQIKELEIIYKWAYNSID